MKNCFTLVILLVFSGCQTTKIKNDTYKISETAVEIGSIGEVKSFLNLQNSFKVRTLPKLQNEIRITMDIVPFTQKLAKIYNSKSAFNQRQSKMVFNDSLVIKSELVTIRILDITGFVNELNKTYNQDVSDLLINTNDLQVVSSIAIVLSDEDLAKIRQADTYYLTNSQDRKYTISLYEQGKKTGTLDTRRGTVIGQKLSKFCWSESHNGKSAIVDITEDECKGLTKSHPQKRKTSKNLYKL